ncbi:MAG: 6-phosphogluconate dehydrogenase [Parcubacteria group bacterium Gr01-1014_48]|nr:MAG: 6-phosphogluconate dehydrogenase [Parcubacteria group bacterium Greene0416_14]TSC72523.1 MAG: 6-phosphogluconate dehydrogenase [Parcubacteria group bacterium Gr01-1014_48]TSD00874.1 MAG: 6-phosphogluconate dehydrogenase [Parcubacteria group bacterium Greene1014_15]TSD07956.1 MAG: 6-phosphogluconate dehydrogenase [Parcubacteria group bacterium Greene0714_4]
MTLGYVGLGKMGCGMIERLIKHGHAIVAHDASREAVLAAARMGAEGVYTLEELVQKISSPKVIWLMVPHSAVDKIVSSLLSMLAEGDTILDGGNSFYKDSMRRYELCKQKGIAYIDVGVSGGPHGAREGACLMISGERKQFESCEALFKDIALPDGYRYVGSSGAGHFVKMIHNGIEYGMMQAIGEGFAIMRKAPFAVELYEIADLYNHGSVIESRLVGWLSDAYKRFGDDLNAKTCCTGSVSHSGEGEWSVQTAEEFSVPAPVIKAAFDFRVASQTNPSYTGQVVSALRYMFGGHDVKPK